MIFALPTPAELKKNDAIDLFHEVEMPLLSHHYGEKGHLIGRINFKTNVNGTGTIVVKNFRGKDFPSGR